MELEHQIKHGNRSIRTCRLPLGLHYAIASTACTAEIGSYQAIMEHSSRLLIQAAKGSSLLGRSSSPPGTHRSHSRELVTVSLFLELYLEGRP